MKRLWLSTTLILAAAAALNTPAAAQITEGWTGNASLSGSSTTGNTETTDIGLGLGLAKEAGQYKHNFNASYDLGSNAGEDTKNRLFLGYQLDRQINDRLYGFGTGNYFKDDFGAYDSGYYVGAGLGYKVLTTAPALWDVEAGLGYRSQDTRAIGTFGQAGFVASDSIGEAAARLGSKFTYDFNDAVAFYNNSEILSSESDTYLWNDAGITAKLTENLSGKVSFRADHHTEVPLGTEKTDTITRIGVIYAIK